MNNKINEQAKLFVGMQHRCYYKFSEQLVVDNRKITKNREQ
jgi:hypothetical protein